jgi:hypothetical protein
LVLIQRLNVLIIIAIALFRLTKERIKTKKVLRFDLIRTL